jgi:hypothetical protein
MRPIDLVYHTASFTKEISYMTNDPYKTPSAELAIETDEEQFQFYVVSIRKFTVLFFITTGLYAIYWFYINWKNYRNYSGKSIWPVPRAIFSIFFTHSLFSEVQNSLNEKGKTYSWNPGSLATIYVVLTIASQILDKMSRKDIGSPYTDLLSILILPFIYSALVKAQKAINFSQNDPEGDSNNTYTIGNYIWIALGTALWMMITFGFLMIFGMVNLE